MKLYINRPCLIIMLVSLFFVNALQGQDAMITTGIIKYETSRDAKIGAAGQQFTQRLNIKTTYRFLKDKARYEAVMMGGISITIFVRTQDNNHYQTLDYKGKSYAVSIPSKGEVLSITDETKEILGYSCTKALVKYDDKEAEVYFTKQIPFNHSPVGNFDLGGAILSYKTDGIDANATEIESSTVTDKEVTMPKGRKEITMEERKALFTNR